MLHSPSKTLLIAFLAVSCEALSLKGIVSRVLKGGKGKGKGSSGKTRQQIWYDQTEFISWTAPCESGETGCTVEFYNAPLYNPNGTAVGNVQFFDILQNNNVSLWVSEQATYQFTDGDYIKYFQYEYAYESSTGSSIWPDGYSVDVTSYSSAGNVKVKEELEVMGSKRAIKLEYDTSKTAKTYDMTRDMYYDKTEFVSRVAPCQSGEAGCTVEFYNAPLRDVNGNEIGNVQFFDILQNNSVSLWVSEQATYQFTDGADIKYFQYLYAFESSTGSSIWPDGYSVDVSTYAASGAGGMSVNEQLVVAGNRRNISINYEIDDLKVFESDRSLYYDRTEFVSRVAPCQSGEAGCTVEFYNAPLRDVNGNEIGNVQFFDILQNNSVSLWVSEQATYQFTDGADIKYFQYLYAFESSTGSSIWPDGYSVDVTSYASDDDTVREQLVVVGNRRNIELDRLSKGDKGPKGKDPKGKGKGKEPKGKGKTPKSAPKEGKRTRFRWRL